MSNSEKMVKIQLTSKLSDVPNFVNQHVVVESFRKINRLSDSVSSLKLVDVKFNDEKSLLNALLRIADIRLAIRDIDVMFSDSQDVLQGLVNLINMPEEFPVVPESKE